MQTVEVVERDSDKAVQVSTKQACFDRLMSARGNYPNDFYLARILSSWISGDGVLPANLGLSRDDFHQLVARHFVENRILIEVSNKPEFDRERIPEWEDLVNLMVEFRAGDDVSEPLMAQIVAAACMGLDHLWQDLGLWSRGELTEVLTLNFPKLARLNNKDMKWKKFLYKQLCERDGTFVCRAPSCDVCADYQVCFGPEE
ncbi:MAG: nitrogen fixation protein NifQ [Gammaproteobacteria bacterium]|jgi:nitrogen fixation protein NifQ